MKFNKQKLLLKFLLICFLLVESTGFDLYAHSAIYYYYDIQITHSYSLMDNIIILPRYGFLSSLYEFASSIGMPLGIFALILTFYPINLIVNHFGFNYRGKIKFYEIIMIIFLSIMIFFYSGLSISILYILAFLISKKQFLLIGVFFHPVTIFLFPVCAIFLFNSRIKFIIFIYYLFFLSYCFFFTKYSLQTSFSTELIKFNINIENIFDLIKYTYELKPNEINLMIIISFLFLFFVNDSRLFFTQLFKYLKIKIFSIRQLNLILFSSLILLQFYFNIKDRATFFNSFLSNNRIIYTTWFDYGSKDYNKSFETLSNER